MVIKRINLYIIFVWIVTFIFILLQYEKLFLTNTIELGYFITPDELYYVAPAQNRLEKLALIYSGIINDWNLNIYALFTSTIVNNYGRVYLSIFNIIMLIFLVMLIKRCQVNERWKVFLLLNPVLPYVATSYLRDIVIYVLIMAVLSSTRLSSFRNIIFGLLLSVLRPAAGVFTLLLRLYSINKSLYILGVVIVSLLILLVLYRYEKNIDIVETGKRIAQIFGLDILSKSGERSFASDIDIVVSAYLLLYWNYFLMTKSLVLWRKFPVYLLVGLFPVVFLYCSLYASYLGFFVARTLYPLLIFCAFSEHIFRNN